MRYRHVPVMAREVVRYLGCSPGKTYVDGTLGGGGHARAILRAIGPDGFLIGVDQDPDAVAWARESLGPFSSNIALFNDNFARLARILEAAGKTRVHGIVLDLGVSRHQLQGAGRGFSFQRDEPLDMRMNPATSLTAEHIVNEFSEHDIASLITRYGEERWAARIAAAIVRERRRTPISSSLQLAALIVDAIPARHRPRRIHPATRSFQALRMAVNDELANLSQFLKHALDVLYPKGRICILSFHSLEDRMVKQHFAAMARGCVCPVELAVCVCGKSPEVRILTKKPVTPSRSEIEANPMARSAKLRAVEKLEDRTHE